MAIGSPRQLLGFWHERTFDGPSEFSWGPGLVPPDKESAPPSEGGEPPWVCRGSGYWIPTRGWSVLT